MGKITARPGERVLAVMAVAALVASAMMSLVVSPPDVEQGTLIRLMYVHVPSAWVAYLSFGVVFVASIAFLAFTLLYVYLMALRLRVGRLEDRLVAEALSPRVGELVEILLENDREDPATLHEDAEEVS